MKTNKWYSFEVLDSDDEQHTVVWKFAGMVDSGLLFYDCNDEEKILRNAPNSFSEIEGDPC